MTLEEKVMEAIENLSSDEAVSLWNEYCSEDGRMDDYIYSMNEFDEIMGDMTPLDVARTCFYGDFCPANDYFWFNGYANLESSDFPSMDDKSPFYAKELATWIIKNENALYCDEIQEILDEDDEEEKDEDEEDE